MLHYVSCVVKRSKWLTCLWLPLDFGRYGAIDLESLLVVNLHSSLFWWDRLLSNNLPFLDRVLSRIQIVVNSWVLLWSASSSWQLTLLPWPWSRSGLWRIPHFDNTAISLCMFDPFLLLSARGAWIDFTSVGASIHSEDLWNACTVIKKPHCLLSYWVVVCSNLSLTLCSWQAWLLWVIVNQVLHAYFIMVLQTSHLSIWYNMRVLIEVSTKSVVCSVSLEAFTGFSTYLISGLKSLEAFTAQCLTQVRSWVKIALMTVLLMGKEVLILSIDYKVLLQTGHSHLFIAMTDCIHLLKVRAVIYLIHTIVLRHRRVIREQPFTIVATCLAALWWMHARSIEAASAFIAFRSYSLDCITFKMTATACVPYLTWLIMNQFARLSFDNWLHLHVLVLPE